MNRTGQVLVGCGIGCGILLLASVGACIGFVSWLKRPGELLEPSHLLDRGTLAHVEWTLRSEDPGTEQAFRALLEALDKNRNAVPFLPQTLRDWSKQRDEREMRTMFPMALTWSLTRGATPAEHEQLFAASMPNIGNRIRIADWFLGFAAGRDKDLEEVDHAGEQIYRLRRNGFSFFIRRDGVFFTSDVERAKAAVDELDHPATDRSDTAALVALLDALPQTSALRGAALGDEGASSQILEWLAGGPIEDVDLSSVQSLSIAGGFTPSAAFESMLTVRSSDPTWGAANGDKLATALASHLDAEVAPVDPKADPLVLRIAVDDPAGAVRQRFDRAVSRPRRGARQ